MSRPFQAGEKVYYTTTHQGEMADRIECIILDGFYQEKTEQRKEGWRLLLWKCDPYGDKDEIEKHIDELTWL